MADQMMGTSVLRIGIAGCGRAARIHLDRLLGLPDIQIIGCADADEASARSMATKIAEQTGSHSVPAFADHRALLRQQMPDALFVFTPHLWHYRPAMDALQAGSHLFVEKPLSTNLQEAVDIVGLARGRSLMVGVGHQYRLCPSIIEARRRLQQGSIGKLRLATATLARPWLATQQGAQEGWRFDRKVDGGGILADAGDHLIDALLWTTGQGAQEVCVVQDELEPGLDLVTAAAIRLLDGTPVALAVSGVSPGSLFEVNLFGEQGRLRVTDLMLEVDDADRSLRHQVPLPPSSETIDGNFVNALLRGTPLCCPADEALDTVRLIEAIARSASARELVRLI